MQSKNTHITTVCPADTYHKFWMSQLHHHEPSLHPTVFCERFNLLAALFLQNLFLISHFFRTEIDCQNNTKIVIIINTMSKTCQLGELGVSLLQLHFHLG